MSLTTEELQAWRDEVDNNLRKKLETLAERIQRERPDNIGLQMGRSGLAGEIRALEAVSICLGQVIRGKRL